MGLSEDQRRASRQLTWRLNGHWFGVSITREELRVWRCLDPEFCLGCQRYMVPPLTVETDLFDVLGIPYRVALGAPRPEFVGQKHMGQGLAMVAATADVAAWSPRLRKALEAQT